ncbi:unnamed protein product [Symbiodinium microadriaticum]|uniref:TrmB family transcriptional regulator n=1 Tax=Pyruvatibacter mobilis TaxID=1712261 RepID=UPI001A439317|nr:unnamed protein product [Symbiodinium microadriaticum]
MSKFFDSLERDLEALGLGGRLGAYYIAALKMGSAPVHTIAREAGIGRTTAYALVERLRDEGLVTLVQKSGRTHVVAENPDVLSRNLETRKQRLAGMLPTLRALYQEGDVTPRFQVYEGVEGIETVLNTVLLAETQTVRAILSMQELMRMPGLDVIDRFASRRVTAGKWLNVLRSRVEETDDIWPDSAADLRRVRYARADAPFVSNLFLFDNKIGVISSRRENYGLILESHEFANLQIALFDVMWEQSSGASGTSST